MSSIQISLHDDIRKMTDSLGRFRADMRTKVVRRALTKAGRRANTEAVRAVRSEYKVPAKAVRKALTTRVSTDDAMEVALSLKGSPTPLADLSPRAYGGPSGWPTRGGKGKVRRPGGVTVKIKGKIRPCGRLRQGRPKQGGRAHWRDLRLFLLLVSEASDH